MTGIPAPGRRGGGGLRRPAAAPGIQPGARRAPAMDMTRALGSRLSALGSRLSALGSRLSALGSRLSALGSRLSALGSRLSALGSRLSALGSRLSALGSYLQCDPQPPPRSRNPRRAGGLRPEPAPAPPSSERARRPPRTRLWRVHAEDGILAVPATVPWAAHTSTFLHPSGGQSQGSAAHLPAPAGWRFAKPPPSRAGAIAASTQIACNNTRTRVKWV